MSANIIARIRNHTRRCGDAARSWCVDFRRAFYGLTGRRFWQRFGVRRHWRREWASLYAEYVELAKKNARSEKEAQYYRAQLMQLRVEHAEERQRMGWMVSAFIPEEVIDKVKSGGESGRLSFIQKVAAPLVDNALKGVFRLNRTGQRVQALVFEPVSLDSKLKQISIWRDGTSAPSHIVPEKTLKN